MSGVDLRMRRLRGADGRVLMVPLDHTISDGPIGRAERTRELVDVLAAQGADAVVVHKGRVHLIDPAAFLNIKLVVHLSASTSLGLDADAKVRVTSVEHALRLGADAVSIHVNIGSRTEGGQLRDAGNVADACGKWGLPLIAMMYHRGPAAPAVADAATQAHLAAIATDIGADVVKLQYTGDPDSMREVVRTCPIPVVVAGGSLIADEQELFKRCEDVMTTGATGLAVGRNVFAAAHPREVVERLAEIVHSGAQGCGRTSEARAVEVWA